MTTPTLEVAAGSTPVAALVADPDVTDDVARIL